jgi:hypothetical protein
MLKLLPTLLTAMEAEEWGPEDVMAEAKSGAISVNGSDASALLSNAIYIVPVMIFIIILDFAIFGAYASRSSDLNPVSDFFFHVRRGFNIVSQRTGAAQYNSNIYQKYHKQTKTRYQR